MRMNRRTVPVIVAVLAALAVATSGAAQAPSTAPTVNKEMPSSPGLPSETPETFVPTDHGFNYTRRNVMIPMRDGVKLHTVILVPKGAENAPILLTRTPYDATALTTHAASSHLGPSPRMATTTPPT